MVIVSERCPCSKAAQITPYSSTGHFDTFNGSILARNTIAKHTLVRRVNIHPVLHISFPPPFPIHHRGQSLRNRHTSRPVMRQIQSRRSKPRRQHAQVNRGCTPDLEMFCQQALRAYAYVNRVPRYLITRNYLRGGGRQLQHRFYLSQNVVLLIKINQVINIFATIFSRYLCIVFTNCTNAQLIHLFFGEGGRKVGFPLLQQIGYLGTSRYYTSPLRAKVHIPMSSSVVFIHMLSTLVGGWVLAFPFPIGNCQAGCCSTFSQATREVSNGFLFIP